MEEKRTRVRRTVEERKAELTEKIAYHQKLIEQLTVKRDKIGEAKPKTERKPSMSSAIKALKEAEVTPEEILAYIEKQQKKKK
ncbi:MAG: hypothetical protein VB115_14455 [Christensenellaceae bacterium]|nr:hypothetical protein [Christensenellaceae bacterium]